MKIYVYASACSLDSDILDIDATEVFTSMQQALDHFNETLLELTSEEGGWTLYSKQERHATLIDGNDEFVMTIVEHDI